MLCIAERGPAQATQRLHPPHRPWQSTLYCSRDYHKIIRKHGITASVSGKGNCYDTAAVESFLKSPKAEMVWRRNWQARRGDEVTLFEYINDFYNPRRRHSALGWKSPVAFEPKAAQHEHLTGTEPRQDHCSFSTSPPRIIIRVRDRQAPLNSPMSLK